jgi:hypothetical protein
MLTEPIPRVQILDLLCKCCDSIQLEIRLLLMTFSPLLHFDYPPIWWYTIYSVKKATKRCLLSNQIYLLILHKHNVHFYCSIRNSQLILSIIQCVVREIKLSNIACPFLYCSSQSIVSLMYKLFSSNVLYLLGDVFLKTTVYWNNVNQIYFFEINIHYKGRCIPGFKFLTCQPKTHLSAIDCVIIIQH